MHLPELNSLPEKYKSLEPFYRKTFRHPHFIELQKIILDQVEVRRFSELAVTITGPSGVGKTRLALELVGEINRQRKGETEVDPSILPACMSTFAGTGRGFNFRHVYTSALQDLGEPFAGRQTFSYSNPRHKFGPPRRDESEGALQHTLLNALTRRKVSLMVFDEAQDLSRAVRSHLLSQYSDVVKYLTKFSPALLVFMGADESLSTFDCSAQLARRTCSYPFPAYDFLHSDTDHLILGKLLEEMEDTLPFEEKDYLVDHADLLATNCVGCVGLLRDHILGASIAAINRGSEFPAKSDFEKCKYDKKRLSRLQMDVDHSNQEFDTRGFKSYQRSLDFYANSPKGKRKPGQPGPKKRPLGEDSL